jgi:hypothetical protein
MVRIAMTVDAIWISSQTDQLSAAAAQGVHHASQT